MKNALISRWSENIEDTVGASSEAPTASYGRHKLYDIEFIQLRWQDSDGLPHRDNGPATICYDQATGQELSREWYQHGLLHRDNEPAVEVSLSNGIELKEWILNGQHHRIDGPAILEIAKRPDGRTSVTEEQWLINGQLHRDSGPAVRIYISQGEILEQEEWYQNGLLHSGGDHPSRINYFGPNDTPSLLEWHKHGALHREGAPAQIKLVEFAPEFSNSPVVVETSFIDGKVDSSARGKAEEQRPQVIRFLQGVWKNSQHGEKLHDEDRPSIVVTHAATGELFREEWHLNGNRHREGNPAVISWENGAIKSQQYFENDILQTDVEPFEPQS